MPAPQIPRSPLCTLTLYGLPISSLAIAVLSLGSAKAVRVREQVRTVTNIKNGYDVIKKMFDVV